MDDFENQLAAQARAGMKVPASAADFQIIVTEAQYPVGTVMRRGSTIPIDYKACAPLTPPYQYPLPSEFPSYNLSSSVAAGFGLDNSLLSQIAGAGVKLIGDRGVTVTIADPKIEVIADHDLSDLVGAVGCSAAIQDQVVWYVRGYIVAKRTFLATLAGGADANLKALKVGDFDVAASGQNSVGISDSQPVGFLEVISEISPRPTLGPAPAPADDGKPAHHHSVGLAAPAPPPPQARISAPTPSAAPGRIYVQKDRLDTTGDDVKIIAGLTAAGLAVNPAVQNIDGGKMPTVAQVRYFNLSDAAAANVAFMKLKAFYPSAKLVQFKLPAPQGQFEIWLPRAS